MINFISEDADAGGTDFITIAIWDFSVDTPYAEGGPAKQPGAPAKDAANTTDWGLNNQFRAISVKMIDLDARVTPNTADLVANTAAIALNTAHKDSLHAPSDAQKNSDILKAEIEAKLIGEIASHTHPLSPATINHAVIDIGDWDMFADASVSVVHGLVFADIRTVTVLIRDDNNNIKKDLLVDIGSDNMQVGTTNVLLNRSAGGSFDSVDFDSTAFNRGWITIEYV